MLVDMTTTHVPVLAGELIDLLDPQPGRDRGRLHVRRRRPRAPGRRAPRARRASSSRSTATPPPRSASPSSPPRSPCRTRFIRAPFAEALERAARRGRRAPTSSTSTSACPRCRSTRASAASPTPTTRRWTCAWTPTQELTAADVVNDVGRAPPGARCCATTARSATPGRSPARSSAPARAAPLDDDERARRGRSPPRSRRPPASPAATRPSASSRRIRIAVNDELGQLDAALPARLGAAARRWPICRDFLPLAGRPPREALPRRPRAGLHLPAGPPGLRLRARPGGRAAHPPRRRADARRGRRQPPRAVRPDARRTEARGTEA